MPETPSKLQRDAARSLVTRYLKVRRGENVIIESWDHTMPLASAMVDEARRVGGNVLMIRNDEDSWWRAIDRGQGKLLGDSSAPEWAALKAADVYVNFWGPANAGRIEQDTEDKLDVAFAWNWPWYAVARKAGIRGVRVTAGFLGEGRARQWGVDLAQWERSLLRATLVDPEQMARSGARLSRAFLRGKKVRITHPNGTDVELRLAGKAPRVQDGRPHPWRTRDSPAGMLTSVPAGFVDVVLDSKTAEGEFRANRRTNIWWNWHAEGAVRFTDGKLSSWSFQHGGEEFRRRYGGATAGRDRASAITIGLNPTVRDVPNLEKCEGGCVSLQIGGNRGLGGGNGSNFFTWFSLAGSDLSVDGTPIIRAGKIV